MTVPPHPGQLPRPHRQVLLIINPMAGHYTPKRQDEFARALQQLGFDVRLELTRYRGHGAEIAQAALAPSSPSRPEIIMAGGGDGTIAEIAQAMLNQAMMDQAMVSQAVQSAPCTLAIWPVGSANVLARELGIPFDDTANAALLAKGRTRLLWPGLLTTGEQKQGQAQLFLQMIGVGLDGWVVQHLSTALKKRIGRLAYLITALRLPFATHRRPFTTIINGQEHQGYLTIISKGRLYGGPFKLLPENRYSTPDFIILILHSLNPLAVLWQILTSSLGRRPSCPAFTFTHGDDIRCTAPQPVPAQSDGDYRGITPLHVKACPTPLRVIAPTDGTH